MKPGITTPGITTLAITALVAAALTPLAYAQPIDDTNRFCWNENTGHINFGGPRTDPDDEVFAFDDHLQGFAWSENAGWINLGRGSGPYANTTGLDFGVNRDPVTGELSGYAWSENTGWINFSGGALASPPNPARIEDDRFFGFAWSENTGWINLDDDTVFVALAPCPPDLNNDGTLDFFDLSIFLSDQPDLDGSTSFDFFDLSLYLQLFSAGCP